MTFPVLARLLRAHIHTQTTPAPGEAAPAGVGVSGAGIRLDVVFPGVHLGTERGVVAAPQAVRVLGSDHGAVFPAQSQTYFAVSHAATHQGAMRLGVVRVRCSLAAGSAMVLRCDLCAMWAG